MPGRCWGSRWPAPSTSTSVPRGSASCQLRRVARGRDPVAGAGHDRGRHVDRPERRSQRGQLLHQRPLLGEEAAPDGRRAPLGRGGQHVLVTKAGQRGGGEPAHRPQREAVAHQPEAGSEQRRPEQRVGEHAVDQPEPPARSDRRDQRQRLHALGRQSRGGKRHPGAPAVPGQSRPRNAEPVQQADHAAGVLLEAHRLAAAAPVARPVGNDHPHLRGERVRERTEIGSAARLAVQQHHDARAAPHIAGGKLHQAILPPGRLPREGLRPRSEGAAWAAVPPPTSPPGRSARNRAAAPRRAGSAAASAARTSR